MFLNLQDPQTGGFVAGPFETTPHRVTPSNKTRRCRPASILFGCHVYHLKLTRYPTPGSKVTWHVAVPPLSLHSIPPCREVLHMTCPSYMFGWLLWRRRYPRWQSIGLGFRRMTTAGERKGWQCLLESIYMDAYTNLPATSKKHIPI